MNDLIYLYNLNKFDYVVNQQIINKLKIDYEKLDEKLFKRIQTINKKTNNKLIVINKVSRKIITPYGKIFIKRRKYFDKKTKKYFCALDKKIKLIKNTCYSNLFLNLIKNEIINGNCVIEKIRKKFFHKISRTQFRCLIKRIKNNILLLDKKKLLNSKRNLYINIDDTFIKFKENNKSVKKRIRLYVFHQGKNLKTNKLINLTYYIKIKEKEKLKVEKRVIQNKKELIFILNGLYNGKAKQNIICSDGAKEFCFLAKELRTHHILDKWHLLYSKFFRILNPLKKEYDNIDKNVRKNIFKYLVSISKNEPDKLLTKIKHYKTAFLNTDNNSIIGHNLKKIIGYIKNNLNGIKFWKNKNYYSPTTEPFIFHKIKRYLGNKNKCYSKNMFLNLLLIKQNYENNC